MAHVELVHEELAVVDNKYVSCAKCQSEVVGMYYASTRAPGHNLCFRCYQADLRGNWWVGVGWGVGVGPREGRGIAVATRTTCASAATRRT